MRVDPSCLAVAGIRLPFAARGNATCATPVTRYGYGDAGHDGEHDEHAQGGMN